MKSKTKMKSRKILLNLYGKYTKHAVLYDPAKTKMQNFSKLRKIPPK
jgi:hypothetical protein